MYEFVRLSNERAEIFLRAAKMGDDLYDTFKNNYNWYKLFPRIDTHYDISRVLIYKATTEQTSNCIFIYINHLPVNIV